MFADSGTGLGLGGPGGFGWGLGSGSTGQDYIRRPELKMLVPPIYPKDAEERKFEGMVELHIHITTMGTVDQVLVIKSSGWASMDKAAVKAAQKTLFRPAVKGGEHVPMWINYPIQFALNKAR